MVALACARVLSACWCLPFRYGRADYAAVLMDAGASITAKNETGKTPLDLVKVNAQNPVNADEAVMKRLRGGSHFDDV